MFVHEVQDDEEFLNSDAEYTSGDESLAGLSEGELLALNGQGGFFLARWARFLPVRMRAGMMKMGRACWSMAFTAARWIGKSAWILTTSALLIGLPILYAYDREKSMLEYEKEQQRFAPPVADGPSATAK